MSTAQNRQDRLEALHTRLVDEVRKIRTGDDWRAWLDTAARFHQYSFRNVLLIAAQRPDATTVAGYTTWKKLGRQVNKGERGIAILAPVLSRRQSQVANSMESAEHVDHGEAVDRADKVDESVERDDTDLDQCGRSSSSLAAGGRLVGVRPTYVWDISQTSGKPLPSPPIPAQLSGDAPVGLWDTLAEQVTTAGFTLHREAIAAGGEYGYTSYADRRVVVAERLGPADAAATLAHEVAHLVMHHPADFPQWTTRSCRGVREVEAESVAYLIAAHHGLATDTATFPYVATWASTASTASGNDKTGQVEPERVVQDTGQRVMTTARQLLDAMAPATDEPGEYASTELTTVRSVVARRSVGTRGHALTTAATRIRPTLPAVDQQPASPAPDIAADR